MPAWSGARNRRIGKCNSPDAKGSFRGEGSQVLIHSSVHSLTCLFKTCKRLPLSTHPSIHLSICLSIYPSICPPVFVLNPQGYHWIMSRTQCARLQKVPESLQGRAVVTHNITMSSSSVLLCHHYCIFCPESHCCSLCTVPASLDPSTL